MFFVIPLGKNTASVRRGSVRIFFLIVVVALGGICMTGCAGKSSKSARGEEPIQVVPPEFFNPSFPSQSVLIEPGDVLTVKFYYNPELNSAQIVRPDGKISLTLLQGLEVAGESPEALQSRLLTLYSKEFVNPVISVEIEKKSNTSVFVSGQVTTGGIKSLQANTTIGQMLAQSGVKERDADLSSVVLVRKHGDKLYKVYKVDARFEQGVERDIYLAPGDMIIVPRNAITILGDFVQKYIRDVVPPQMNIMWGLNTDLNTALGVNR